MPVLHSRLLYAAPDQHRVERVRRWVRTYFSLPLLPSHTFLFSSVVSWPAEVLQIKIPLQCGLSSGCSSFRKYPSAPELSPLMCCRKTCFTTVFFIGCRESQLQYLGHLLLSILLWLQCSHFSFSLLSPPPPPPVQHFFLFPKHVFPKKQENCPMIGPIQKMGTCTHFPLPTVPLL